MNKQADSQQNGKINKKCNRDVAKHEDSGKFCSSYLVLSG
jgi:hypothetical protein